MDRRRQHSLAHQASARLNTLAAKSAALSDAESPPCRQSACRPSHIGALRPDNRSSRVLSRPWNKIVTWDRTPLGLKTATPFRPRAALTVEGSERRWNFGYSKVPALHREAEHDTTGSFSRQPLLHTWIARQVQGRRRPTATLCLIRHGSLKR